MTIIIYFSGSVVGVFTPPRGVLKFPGGVFALLSKHPLGGVFKNLGVIRDQSIFWVVLW